MYNNEGKLQLWRNGTSLGSGGPGNVSENAILPAGPNNYSAILLNIANYTYSNVSYTMFIQKATPILGIATNNSFATGSGLVGYWSFDENTTQTARDQSGFGNDATWTGANNVTHNMTGRFGNALSFDGADDYATISTTNNPLNVTGNQITVMAWFYVNLYKGCGQGGVTRTTITSPYGGYMLTPCNNGGVGNGNDYFSFNVANSTTWNGILRAGGVFASRWYHVAGTYNGTTLGIYIDGVLINSTGHAGNIRDNAAPLLIGTNLNNFFNGSIDEVRIYNYSLSAQEINDSAKGIWNDLAETYPNATNVTGFVRLGDTANGIELSRNGTPVAYTNDSALVGWWHFDEDNLIGNTVANDSSGWNNKGTLTGGVSHITGRLRNALQFDGVNDYVDLGNPSSLAITDNLTISAWIYSRGFIANNYDTIVSKRLSTDINQNTAYGLATHYNSNNLIFFRTNYTQQGGSVAGTASLQTNTWYHVAVTYTSLGTTNIYINGALDTTSNTLSGSINTTNGNNVYIGIRQPTNEIFNGTIDEVKIYNRTLSTREIQLEYQRGVGEHDELSAAGIYQYNVTYQESQNYTAYNVSKILSVPQGNITFHLYTNGTEVSINYSYGAPTNISLYKTHTFENPTGTFEGGFTLFKNGTSYTNKQSGPDNITDDEILAAGIYNYTGYFSSANYTSITVQRILRIEKSTPILGIQMNNTNKTGQQLGEVLHLSFDENDSAAKVYDQSGFGNDGTWTGVNNVTRNMSGRFGNALTFDGVDDYATVPDAASINVTNETSVEMWIAFKYLGATDPKRIINKLGTGPLNGFNLDVNSSYLRWEVDNNGASNQATVYNAANFNIGQWYHIAATFKNGNTSLFVNGALVSSAVPTIASIGNTNAPLLIGKWSVDYFNGSIDEVRVYNYSRSFEEINASARGVWNDMPLIYPRPVNTTAFVRLGDAVNGIELSRNGTPVAYTNDSALVGWWHFDEDNLIGNNQTNDSSGWNNMGIMTGGANATRVTGKLKGALQFDGVDDFVDLGSGSSLNMQNMTVSAWIKGNTLASNMFILTRGTSTQVEAANGYYFRMNDPTNLQCLAGQGTGNGFASAVSTGNLITGGVWHHAVCVIGAGNVKIYIDGVLNATVSLSTTSLTNSGNTFIAGNNQGAGTYFKGTIDEVKVYNRTLTASEINTSYLAGIGQFMELSAAGIYQYNATYQESQNYTAYNVSKILSIPKASTTPSIFFNGTNGNNDYNRSDWINATGFLATPLGFFSGETKILNLTFNYTGPYSANYTSVGVLTTSNNTIYNITINDLPNPYNFTLWFAGDQNYSESSVSRIVGIYGNLWIGLVLPSTAYYSMGQNVSLNATVRDYLRGDEITSVNVSMNLTSLYANGFKNVPYYSRNVSMLNFNVGNYSSQYNVTDIHAGNYSLNYTAARAFYRNANNFTTIYVNASIYTNISTMFVNVTQNITQNQGVLINGTLVRLGNQEINGTLDVTIRRINPDNVGLIVSNASALDTYEYLYNSTLTTAGYNVTLIDDDTVNAGTWAPSLYNVIVWGEASYDNFFMKYISQNVWGQIVGGKPVVMTYYGMIKGAVDMNLSSTWGGRFQRDANVKVSHAVTGSYNATNVSEIQDVTYNSLYLFDFKGTELADDGTSGRTIIGVNDTNAGRVVAFGPYRATYWTAEAKDMFLRSVYWAIYGAAQTTYPQTQNVTIPYTFEDHFNESDGSAEGWNATIGSWIVQNGAYIQTANSSSDINAITKIKNNSYWTDYTTSLRFNMLGGVANNTQVYVRYESSTQYYLINIPSTGDSAIYKNSGAGAANITDASAGTINIQKDTWYTMNITTREDRVEAEIGGLGRINTTDVSTPITGGLVALGTEKSSARFDDVAVYHHDGGYKNGMYYFKREWGVGTQPPGTYRATTTFTYYNDTGNRTVLTSSVDFNVTSNLTAQINITLNASVLSYRNVIAITGNVTAGGNLGVTGNLTLSVWNATYEITNLKNLTISATPSSPYQISEVWNSMYNFTGNYSLKANFTWGAGSDYQVANFTVSYNASADVNVTLNALKYTAFTNVTVNVSVRNPVQFAITTLTLVCNVTDYNGLVVGSATTNPDIGSRTIGAINPGVTIANATTWNVSANNAGTYSVRCNVNDAGGLIGYDVKTFDVTRINATIGIGANRTGTNYTVNDAVGISGNISSVGGINVTGTLTVEVYNSSQRISQIYSSSVVTAANNFFNITNLNLTFQTYKNFTGVYTLNASFNYTNESQSQVVRSATTQFNISSNTNATITTSANQATYGTTDTASITTTITSTANQAITNGNLTVYIFNSTTFNTTYRYYWNSSLYSVPAGGSATRIDTVSLASFNAGTHYVVANFTFAGQNINATSTFTISVIVPSTNLTVKFFVGDNANYMVYTTPSNEIPANKTNATSEWNTRWIASFFNDSVIGLYGTGGGVDVGASNTTIEHRINVNGLISQSKIYAIVTKGTRQSFQNRAELLDQEKFTTQINPSFGYPLRDKNLLTLKLKYTDIDVQGTETLQKGTYKLRIENNGTLKGKTLISIKTI